MTDVNEIVKFYRRHGSIKQTAAEFGVGEGTVRKALISAGAFESKWSARIAKLREDGYKDAQIAEMLHISVTAVNTHSPYTKGAYNSVTPSANATRIRNCRKRKEPKP